MAQVEFPTPETIGPYRVLRPIARGGMGAVFEAEDPANGERVAVKLLTHRGLARPRFAREYKALTRLDHKNIVRVYRYGMHEGNPYLSMEFLDGDPVQVHVHRQGPPGDATRGEEVVRVGVNVSRALAYLHERGIVHRDLKSSNIMVLPEGQVKLLDFGTARQMQGEEEITRRGEFVGTFAYASPEQITGESVDAKSDLYSLGVLLYRLSTGRRPFKADSPHELARMHVERRPVPPRKLVPMLPEALDQLILRLLEKDPADRPESATVVAEFLASQLVGIPQAERPTLGPSRLVGRTRQLEQVTELLGQESPGKVVLVVGSAGSGRSRMMRSVVAGARQKGWRCYSGRFGGERGLGVLLEVADDVQRTLGIEDETTAEFGDDIEMATGTVQEQLFGYVATSLIRCAQDEGRVLVALGDLHRASPVALDALSYTRQRCREAEVPVLFLATAPDDSDAPGTAIRKRLPEAGRVDLQPLEPEEVQKLVQSMLGGQPPSMELARSIHKVTGGMPGFVGEVVRAMVQGSLLEARKNREGIEWVDRTGGEIGIPSTARDAIRLRLDALPVEALRLLQGLAVAGGEARTKVLAHAVERPPVEVAPILQDLVSRRLLNSRDGARDEIWSFRMALTRELLMERLRDLRRDVFQRLLAQAMRGEPPGPAKIRLLAEAGWADEAIAETVEWAVPLLEWDRAEEVAPVLATAVAAVPSVKKPDRETLARLYLASARCRLVSHPGDPEAKLSIERAYALAPTEMLRGEINMHHARLQVAQGDLDGAWDLLEKARTRVARAPALLKAEVGMNLGRVQWYRGHFDEAMHWFEAGLENARRHGQGRYIARALLGRGVVHLARGEMRAAETDLREAALLYEQAGDREGLWHAQANLCDLLRHKAAFAEGVHLLAEELPAVREGASAFRYALMLLNLAELEVEMIRLGRARQRVERVETELDLGEHLHLRAGLGLVKAKIALASGDHAEAHSLLDLLVGEAEDADLRIISSQLRVYRGEARVNLGRMEQGADDLALGIQELQEEGHMPVLGEACAARARALSGREDPDLSFGPVLQWMFDEPVYALRMEYLLASARYAESLGSSNRAFQFFKEAEGLLQEIHRVMKPADQAAMSIHPWATAIRRGLGQ